jgi:DNA-binding transcriptional LysR family regulator
MDRAAATAALVATALRRPMLSGVSILSAVVEAGNFVRAAELLNMTPSGVSHGVARLEARVGARLFNRTTRALHLTDEGRRLYERVSPLLGEIEEAANEASGATEVARGRLRVNVDPFFSRLVLAAHLAAFLQNHPQLRLGSGPIKVLADRWIS